jgi:xylulokinase
VEQATAPLAVSRPKPLWSEQDPDAWRRATDEAVLAFSAESRGAVEAVGDVGPAYGAAKLAELSQGRDASDVLAPPEALETTGPRAEDVAALAAKRSRFKDAYRALKPLFAGGD